MPDPAIPTRRLGVLLVVSGPSGSGKTTLCRQLRDAGDVLFSVSCTTRRPRNGEIDGSDYFYTSESEFLSRVTNGDFLEYARVHGNFYGTLKNQVFQNLDKGIDVLLDLDVQGAAQVRACDDARVQSCLVDVFILPPSLDELKKRLASRGTENENELALRLRNSIDEMRCWQEYRYTILSGNPSDDIVKFKNILEVERLKSSRLR